MKRLIFMTSISFAVLHFAEPRCSASWEEGCFSLGVEQEFSHDRDITPREPIEGWRKGEINRGQSTLLKAGYGVTDSVQLAAILGHTRMSIEETRSDGVPEYVGTELSLIHI